MTTSLPAKVRRAKPTDVVNIYRLWAEEIEQHPLVPADETLALGTVLATTEKGLVVVAEHSGRIVGSIGLDLHRPEFSSESLLACRWFAVVPSYKETTIGLALLKRALAIVDQYGIRVSLSPSSFRDDKRMTRWLKAVGFDVYSTNWLRQNKKSSTDEPQNQDTDGEHQGTGPPAEPTE